MEYGGGVRNAAAFPLIARLLSCNPYLHQQPLSYTFSPYPQSVRASTRGAYGLNLFSGRGSSEPVDNHLWQHLLVEFEISSN